MMLVLDESLIVCTRRHYIQYVQYRIIPWIQPPLNVTWGPLFAFRHHSMINMIIIILHMYVAPVASAWSWFYMIGDSDRARFLVEKKYLAMIASQSNTTMIVEAKEILRQRQSSELGYMYICVPSEQPGYCWLSGDFKKGKKKAVGRILWHAIKLRPMIRQLPYRLLMTAVCG